MSSQLLTRLVVLSVSSRLVITSNYVGDAVFQQVQPISGHILNRNRKYVKVYMSFAGTAPLAS
jgi:hypothetical protein